MSHAFLAPSSAQRAYNCPASVIRQEIVDRRIGLLREVGAEFYGLSGQGADDFVSNLTEDNTSADLGTQLHKLFEDGVNNRYHALKVKTEYEERQIKGGDFILDKMCEIIEYYKEYIMTLDEYEVEKRIKIKGLPQYGTTDFVGIKGRRLLIEDLKTGYGEVYAKDNDQLMTYAVGCLDEYGWDNFDDVQLAIIGVRFASTEHVVTIDELREYKTKVMLPAFMDAYSINPTAKQGDWCRYCTAKLYCGEWRDNLDANVDKLFQTELREVGNDELVEIYSLGKQFEKLTKDESSQELILRFDTFDAPVGVKKHSGKKTTYWASSEDDIVNALKEETTEELHTTSLKSPAKLKKLLGDKADMVDEFVGTKTGKPYLTLTK